MKSHLQIVIAFLCLCLCGAALPAATTDCDLDLAKTLRLRGDLGAAKELLAEAIDAANVSIDCRVEQHLEMARVLDRVGLHNNTRPVLAALAHINHAAGQLDDASVQQSAAVELAFAEYYYRAEMREREFPMAEQYARQAISMFAAIGDGHGQADAVHRQGLIEFQRQNLDNAESLFEESLLLDIAAGERPFFRGEYERHIGYVAYRRGDIASAVQHFERSLHARRDAGAIDASLFAAVSLANALIELGRPDDAKPHIDYARNVAQRIESRVGLERVDQAMENLATALSAAEPAGRW